MNCEYPEFDESILTLSGTEVVCPVKTTPLHEFKFRDYCRENGVVSYLPLRRTWKVHNLTSNGKAYNYSKEVLRPMFRRLYSSIAAIAASAPIRASAFPAQVISTFTC